MRVLLYSRVFPPAVGGMERFAEDLAGWMAVRGHSVTILTRSPGSVDGDRHKPYHVVRGSRSSVTASILGNTDVVHVNGLSLKGIAGALVSRRRPVVTHQAHQAICPTGLAWSEDARCDSAAKTPGRCGVCPRHGLVGRSNVRLHRAGAEAAAANVCVSHYLAERANVPRSVTIYNPVADRAFKAQLSCHQQDDVIVFAGRLVAEKGLDVLLHAVAMLPGVRLRIAGEGPMRSVWRRLASELGVGDRSEFLGTMSFSELGELYAGAAVACVPSAWEEPFGYAAAEAMAMGRAVVATPSGALPELLTNGRGFVAAAPTPEALARSLHEALEDPGRRVAVERKAREFALSDLSIECVGPQYEALYQKAAS